MHAMDKTLACLTAVLLLGLWTGHSAYAWSVKTSKQSYAPGESIVVQYSNFSDPRDWISIVRADSASNHYMNDYWTYISNDYGSHTFKGLPAGTYEVRAYCCWGSTHGGYEIRAKQTFTVGASSSGTTASHADPYDARASVNGKYSGLVQTLNCPEDSVRYGDFVDWGHWSGGTWCGQSAKPGYWVWLAPNWYVWANKR